MGEYLTSKKRIERLIPHIMPMVKDGLSAEEIRGRLRRAGYFPLPHADSIRPAIAEIRRRDAVGARHHTMAGLNPKFARMLDLWCEYDVPALVGRRLEARRVAA